MCKCLDSLLHQDIPLSEYELICINDGSPDNSREIAERYSQKYACVKVLSQNNQGPSAARNAGIRAASGEYLYFVDPDDYVKENSLKEILDIMDNEKLDILRFRYQSVNEDYQPFNPYKSNYQPIITNKIMTGKEYLCNYLGYSCFIWTYIYRTSIIKDNNIYCSNGVYFDDTDWLPKVMLQAKRIACVDIVRHYYLVRNDSLVNTKDITKKQRKLEGSLQIIKILFADKTAYPDSSIQAWYQRMITFQGISALTLVATDFYDERKAWIAKMKPYKVFRFVYLLDKYITFSKIKLFLICLSPNLYCRLIHFLHK